jgi:hypothetical protein
VDPFDRYFRRPLADVLVAQGILTRDRADELSASAKSSGEPLGAILLESGAMTAWDLAKTIAAHYQMPVHPLTGYRFERDVFEGLRGDLLHRNQVVPVGRFGPTRTFAVLEPPSRELVSELQAACGPSIFFFVAEGPEVRRALTDNVKVVDAMKDGAWQQIFDVAEQEVMKGLGKKS